MLNDYVSARALPAAPQPLRHGLSVVALCRNDVAEDVERVLLNSSHEYGGVPFFLGSAIAMHDLSENAKFFDRLVDLVPAKYYHPSDQELVNTKYLKKNAKAAAKQVMKEQYKQNKRAKLDPDTAKTSLQIQQQQADDMQQSYSSEENDAAEPDLPQPAQAQKTEPVRTLNLPTGAV